MEFDNQFEVPLPPGSAWRVLMDIERIAPCLPGATLGEKIDERTYKGKVAVRLGPVALSFNGTARFEEIDEAHHSARVKASGMDAKGRGGANASTSFRIEPAGAGSRVLVHTDLTLSGAVAQYGRGAGMIRDVAAELIGQFAASLRALIGDEAPAAAAPSGTADKAASPPAGPPISGLSLLLRVLWRSIRRLFRWHRTAG
jgi:uncharacterized protein